MPLKPRKVPREISLLQILPNFMTVAAICAGLTAIRFAMQGSFDVSVALIAVAAALDGLDGRLARLLKSESEIGAELDSLADFLNFGVAPAMILYLWGLQDTRGLGWMAVLVFAVCCVLRLARFNVGNRGAAPGEGAVFFVGIPSPAGGMLVMLPLYLGHLSPDLLRLPGVIVAAWMVLVGLLMISRFPTPSLKSSRIYAENVKFVVVGFVAAIAALLTYPWATLVIMSVAYLATISWTWRRVRRSARKDPSHGN